MEKYLDQLQKLPLATKAAAMVILIAALTAGNYFMLIQPIEDAIVRLDQEQTKLDQDLVGKQTIANNLNEFKRKKEKLEQQLAEAFTELPQNKDIDELLRQLNDVGKKAGLEITSVAPGSDSPESFYIKIPIAMAVQGSYEEIAVFFESVSKLRRIVNISNVKLGTPTKKSEKVVLNATFSATTFCFNNNAGAKKTP
jgi:type IV pilus assembly protein PilO